jgi:hypothetical protein
MSSCAAPRGWSTVGEMLWKESVFPCAAFTVSRSVASAAPGGSVRRVVLLVAGTVTGLVMILGYRTPASNVTSLGSASQSGGVTHSSSGNGGGSGGGGSNGTSSAPSTRTVTGSTVNTQFGPVQVSVTARGNTITDVQALALPSGDSRSAQISRYAGPQLRQQALAAQSAGIDGVAGASYTSQGYRESLQSALSQLGA